MPAALRGAAGDFQFRALRRRSSESRLPVMALLGPREMSDLSPQSVPTAPPRRMITK